MKEMDRHELVLSAALEYSKTGYVSRCPICNSTQVATQGFVCGDRGSVSIVCANCGELGHFDGLAAMHEKSDSSTIIILGGNARG